MNCMTDPFSIDQNVLEKAHIYKSFVLIQSSPDLDMSFLVKRLGAKTTVCRFFSFHN